MIHEQLHYQTPEFPDWIAQSQDKAIDTEQLNELAESVQWEPRSAEQWQQQLEESSDVISLWDMDSLVGFGRMVKDENDEVMLYDGMIRPAYQGLGLFKTMLTVAEEKLRSEGYTEVHLGEYPGTEAMYRHLGWRAMEA